MAHPETVCQHQVFSFQNMLYLAFPPLINTMGQPAYSPGEGQNVHRIIDLFQSGWQCRRLT